MRHLGKNFSVEFDLALESLTNGIYAFSSVAKKLESRAKEVEEQEDQQRELSKKLNTRNDELDEREKMLKEREARIRERENQVEAREQQIGARMRELGEMEAKRARKEKSKEPNSLPSKVKLNVGGQKFTTSKTTLSKGSFFAPLVSAKVSIQNDDNRLFIDRDPKHFSVILGYLRDGKIPKSIKGEELIELENEFQFYGIPNPIPNPLKQTVTLFNDSGSIRFVDKSLFDSDSFVPVSLQPIFRTWLPGSNYTMIYKASRDGFRASDFHRNCDNKGATLTIIQSKEGYIFGGYSYETWESPANNFNKFKTHPSIFIFTLLNPHSIPPTSFSLKPASPFGINCCSSHCANFGGGDIYVSSDSNIQNSSYTKFSSSFVDHLEKGRETFTGSLNFTTKDVEVYLVN